MTGLLPDLYVTDERGVQTLHPAATERLHEYWVHGEGAAQIGWGSPGDFARCTALLEEHAHFSPEQAHGYCNLAHKSATGMYPATHAKLLGKHRSEEQIHMPTREDLLQLVSDGFDPEIATTGRSAELAQLEGRWFLETLGLRYNDFHAPAGSSTGGQFSSGGSSSSGSSSAKKQAVKKAPAHAAAKKTTGHAPSHSSASHSSAPHGSLAFDGKHGPGYGMKNGDPTVHKVQDDLVRLGFAHKGDKALSDGKYGPKTSAAVKKAQKALGLKQDGIATPALIAKLAGTKSLPHRSAELDLCVRSFGFEFDERAAGDGRTLEGYAAVFNTPTRIRDVGGDFDETILPGAFGRSIRSRMPILQWDHGKDPRVGTVPIGAIQDLSEDSTGLHVRARLFDNAVVEPVRQAIEARAVRGMSFRFGVPTDGDEWPSRDKRNVRDADVHELGPVAFPAYDTTSVSVRSLLAQCDVDERRSLIRELAEEIAQFVDLSDLAGRSGQWMADGGDSGDEPAPATPLSHRQRLDDGALRTRGILL